MTKLSYHLRWNNHLQNLQSLFENLYSEQSLVDVTISCSDGLLYAHKLVLSACSPYFEQIFKGNPCKHPILILRGIKLREMQVLLEYMYAGSVDIVEEELETLISVATELQIKGLMRCSEEQLNPKFKVTPMSPVPKNIDNNLKWQAEIVAQPTGSEFNENESRNDEFSKSNFILPHEVEIVNKKSEQSEENPLGLEMYPPPPTHYEEKVVNVKVQPEDECSSEELSIMDYNEVEENNDKLPDSFEMTQQHISEKKPDQKSNIDNHCEVCKKLFQNKVSYQRHMMTHMGIKPHSCNFCSQSFLRLSHLQRHIRVHTGERPYSCGKCPKQFARSDKLRQHYLLQHNDAKMNKIPKPRGRPRKHVEFYGQSSASYQDPPLSNTGTYPPLSIIPISSNAI